MGRLAATALRLLAPRSTGGVNTASGDDIANLVTTPLPNHTLVWAAGTLLQLDRDDSTTAALLAGTEPVVVVPNIGPGRWKAVGGDAMAAASQQLVSSVHNQVVTVSAPGQWAAMPAAAAFVGGAAGRWFSEGSAQGVLTYNGPSARFRASFAATFLNSIADTTQVRVALSIDGAFIGGAASIDESLTDELAQGVFRPITLHTLVDLTQGQTIQPIATTDNADDPTVHRAIFNLDLVGVI